MLCSYLQKVTGVIRYCLPRTAPSKKILTYINKAMATIIFERYNLKSIIKLFKLFS